MYTLGICFFQKETLSCLAFKFNRPIKYPEIAKRVKFFVGDVRDPQSVADAMPGVDYIFHAAALKQVPSCEFFPMEAVKTNVIGTDNVLTAAISEGVKAVICLSTDKAAYPVNAMGTSKAMMEKVIVAKSRSSFDEGIIVASATQPRMVPSSVVCSFHISSMLGTSKVIEDGSGANVLNCLRVIGVVTSPDGVMPYAHTRYSVSHSAM